MWIFDRLALYASTTYKPRDLGSERYRQLKICSLNLEYSGGMGEWERQSAIDLNGYIVEFFLTSAMFPPHYLHTVNHSFCTRSLPAWHFPHFSLHIYQIV